MTSTPNERPISDDGRWEWDGYTWVPRTPGVPPNPYVSNPPFAPSQSQWDQQQPGGYDPFATQPVQPTPQASQQAVQPGIASSSVEPPPYGPAAPNQHGVPGYQQPYAPFGQNFTGQTFAGQSNAIGVDSPLSPFASFGRRLLASCIDAVPAFVAAAAYFALFGVAVSNADVVTDPATGEQTLQNVNYSPAGVAVVGALAIATILFGLWNQLWRQGRTGQTLGKSMTGIRLVALSTGEPIGVGMCFVRQLAHVLDNLACYLGWFLPLVTSRKQTIADMVCSTVVVRSADGR